jgi:hypothetical protein
MCIVLTSIHRVVVQNEPWPHPQLLPLLHIVQLVGRLDYCSVIRNLDLDNLTSNILAFRFVFSAHKKLQSEFA